MIKCSSNNYRKISTDCLVIDFCLYIAITFHNNFTEAKIVNELIMSVQSNLAYTFGQTLDATDFSCAVSGFGQSREVKYFCHRY